MVHVSPRVFHQTCTRRQNPSLSVRIAQHNVRKSSSLRGVFSREILFLGCFEQTSMEREGSLGLR